MKLEGWLLWHDISLAAGGDTPADKIRQNTKSLTS